MLPPDIVGPRLHFQRLLKPRFRSAGEAVSWFGAVQSQDYDGARWAIGMRAPRLAAADVDGAFNRGEILRTHVMRPTWHFVAPDDIRALLLLTGHRVQAFNASYYRKVGLDRAVVSRAYKVITRVLRDGQMKTRAEVSAALRDDGIEAAGIRLAFVMMSAELDGLVCSGARRGSQFTYAILDERVPQRRVVTRDEALAAFATRYFTSHGPATIRDFAWWSGLTMRDGKEGIALAGDALVERALDGRAHWQGVTAAPRQPPGVSLYLLPNYDECLIAYRDRGTSVAPRTAASVGAFPHQLVIDGHWAGGWRRTRLPDSVHVEVKPFTRLTRALREALDVQLARYAQFHGLPATLKVH